MELFLLAAAFVVVAAAGIAAAVQLVRQRQETAELRAQNAVLARGLDLRERELRHLADVRLPELMESLHNPGVRVAGPLHDLDREAPAYGQALRTVMELFAGSAARVRERADLSAKSTLRAMMRAVQSLANEQQLAISHMQERHDDPAVLEGLLRIDHMNAQLGRRAQATAVLCGSWPGQQRSASSLSDVVRGATGRIRDYRWDQAARCWTPLLDWVGWDKWGYNGVISLAADPVDADRVYAAAGMYTNAWDPNNGAILRSADRGRTWQVAQLPFKLGGNMPGRGMGERLAVDPGDDRVLYFGAPEGNGLWRSTDRGASWSKVSAFPNPGNYSDDPSDSSGYGSHRPGVVWVTFDESTATSGTPTRTIYAGVADKDNTVYRSTDAGASWQRVPGQPTGYIAHKGVLDAAGHALYIATSDTAGPYNGAKGDVWKYDTQASTWTRVSPVPSTSSDAYYGYSGLTIDRQHPNTLMVATQISWWPDVIFFRSTDAGQTWTRVWDWTSYPNRSLRYKLDVSSVPWLTFGQNPAPPEATPKLGWMTESVEIDPFDSDRMMYGTGATIYGTENLTQWDGGGQFTIKPMVTGLEETAVLDLVSPPSGAPLVSGLGDIGGFRHDDLNAVPAMMFLRPTFTSTASLDYAENNPSVMVRAGNFTDSDRPNDSHVAFSTDGGANWFQGTEPGGVNNGGTVAASADGARFVWAPGDSGQHVVYSTGFGNSWAQSSGVPANARIESDRVNPRKFYAFSNGRLYVSTDGGQTFTGATSGLPNSAHFKAVPGHEGDIWLAGDTGLFHSTDSGATFTKLPSVAKAVNVGFGKAAPGRSYQAIYTVATIGGITGVFRSDDTGQTWVRVNDDQHQYGNMGEALTGDPRVYGRVYLGTNGRGIVYGDTSG